MAYTTPELLHIGGAHNLVLGSDSRPEDVCSLDNVEKPWLGSVLTELW
jgi:hypothetical protein